MNTNKDFLRIGTVNCNSLINKVVHVRSLLEREKLMVLGITETWLVGSVPGSYVCIPGYNFYRGDVSGDIRKHGSGVYVSCLLRSVQVEVGIPNVSVVSIVGMGVHVVCAYRPPSYTESENASLMDFLLEFCVGREVVVVGDFNLPSLGWGSADANNYVRPVDRAFQDLFFLLGLQQWVCEGTFHPSGNILDLLFTSSQDSVREVTVLPPLPNCHHSPVYIDYICDMPSAVQQDIVRRLWFKGNYAAMDDYLGRVLWQLEFDGLDVQGAYDVYVSVVSHLVDTYVPLAARRLPVWQSAPPRSLINQKARAWRDYVALRRSVGRHHQLAREAFVKFTDLNYQIRNFSKRKQSDYELSLIQRLGDCPKLFHSYIRRLKKGRPPVGPLKVQARLVEDHGEISEVLADYFAGAFRRDAPINPQLEPPVTAIMDGMQITYETVVKALRGLNGCGAPGPDGVHPHMLKSCAVSMSEPLVLIFSLSLNSGSVPWQWTVSLVSPIHKGGTRSLPGNYRPISLTSVPCKILERLIAAHVMEYMETNCILAPNQFGFRPGRSTEDQLLLFYGKVSQWVHEGNVVDVAYLDLSKAFDVVSHSVLLAKLSALNFHPGIIRWVSSFLAERSMSVVVSGSVSTSRDVTSGVPQGSVLGPILFLTYVNDLMSDSACEWKAYADDFKICAAFRSSEQDTTVTLQSELCRIYSVCSSWNLSINPQKCAIMRFGCVGNLGDPAYFIGGEKVRVVEVYKDLGIHVDCKLKFHFHVRDVVRRAGGIMSELLRSTVCRSPSFMITLFVSHVRPIIDYGSVVWGTRYMGDVRLLESLQRRWTRQISGVAHLRYELRLQELGLFSISGRMLRADLIKVWKCFNDSRELGMNALFTMAGPLPTRGHAFKLRLPLARSDTRRRFFAVRVIPKWNSLPSAVAEATSLSRFKTGLHGFLGDELFETA